MIMKTEYKNLLLLIVLLPIPEAYGQFRIFDSTAYANKPDLSCYGIEPIEIAYVSQIFQDWSSDTPVDKVPDPTSLRLLAQRMAAKDNPVVVDIEHWPLRGDQNTVERSIEKYRYVLQALKREAPSLRIGLYGVLPTVEYHRALQLESSRQYQSWHSENKRLLPIAKDVDYVFPSLYTHNTNRERWKTYAMAQMREARTYGKPVYAFVWPQYHESNRILRKRYIPYDYWRLQLQTVYEHADGIVIWGGREHGRAAKWDEDAAWWTATKRFITDTVGRQPCASQSRPWDR